jgi:hypothetical protein
LLLGEQFKPFEQNLTGLPRTERRKPNYKQTPPIVLRRGLPKIFKRPAPHPVSRSEGRQAFDSGDIGLNRIVGRMLDRTGKVVEMV